MVRAWARATLRACTRVQELHRQVFDEQFDQEEDPTAQRAFLDHFTDCWTAEHTAVWSAHQLQRWAARLASRRGTAAPPAVTALLAAVRNALEHLDEAHLVEDRAEAGPGTGNRALRSLPHESIQFTVGSPRAFGLIDLDELRQRAAAAVDALAHEDDDADRASEQRAFDQWVDEEIDRRRGK